MDGLASTRPLPYGPSAFGRGAAPPNQGREAMLPHERHPDLADDLEYRRDAPAGDGHRFHFYVYYIDATAVPPVGRSFHWAWLITGSDWDPAEMRGEAAALEAERKARGQERIVRLIERELHQTDTLLIKRGNQLVRVRATGDNGESA